MSSKTKIGIITLITILLVFGTLASVVISSLFYIKGQTEDLIASVKSGSWQDAELVVNNLNEELNSPLWATLVYIPVVGQEVSDYQKIASFGSNMFANNEVTNVLDDVLASLDDGNIWSYDSVETLVRAADVVSEPLSELGKELHGKTKYTRLVQAAVPIVEEAAAFSAAPNSIYGGWLVVIMNDAEPKTLGGHPGVWMQIDVSSTGLDFHRTFSVPDISNSVLKDFFTSEEIGLVPAAQMPWSDTPFELFNFPRCAQACLEIYPTKKSRWVATQGVVAMDLWLIQDIVDSLNNPNLVLNDGTILNGKNLAKFLMADGYLKYEDTKAQDTAYAELPNAFLKNLDSGIDFSKALEAVGKAIDDNGLYIWCTSESVREAVESAPCGGDVFSEAREGNLGIILCDRSASKVAWYASVTPQKRPWGANIRLQNTFDVSNGVPEQLVGDSAFARTPAELVLEIYLVAPPGTNINSVECSDEIQFFETFDYKDFSIARGMFSIKPQEDMYLEVFTDGEFNDFYTNLKTIDYLESNS